ncbi:hypothetical protein [Comamonas thiooxydans]|uniref:hypothetical protein n=1 Tax=Comamonas thiooxydans TaxID=363952 RepID=UPI00209BD3D3|nr:hypothetical protein [Comamonas thiooxydans]MCO8250277.1 hypothetical protein [Comamonas thiooxydans]
MSLSASLTNVGHPVAYYPRLARFFGSVNVAILFAQLHYWSQRGESDLGTHKSSEQFTEETGLSYREQVTARKQLREAGFLVETHRRLEHRVYYRLNLEAVDAAFDAWTEAQTKAHSPNDENAFREQPKAQSGGDAERTPGEADSSLDELRQTQSVINTETPHKTPTETPSIAAQAGAKAAKGKEPKKAKEVKEPKEVKPMMVKAPNGVTHVIPGELRYPGESTKSHKTWVAYAIAYQGRYKDWPLWNESVAGQIIKFIDKVGAERAPRIAVHYVRRVEEKFICDQMHPVGLLLSNAQKWATQQQTGQSTPPPSLAPAASHKFAGAGKAIFDGIEL